MFIKRKCFHVDKYCQCQYHSCETLSPPKSWNPAHWNALRRRRTSVWHLTAFCRLLFAAIPKTKDHMKMFGQPVIFIWVMSVLQPSCWQRHQPLSAIPCHTKVMGFSPVHYTVTFLWHDVRLEKCRMWKNWGIFLKLQRFLRLFISFIHVICTKGWAYIKFSHPPQRFWPFAEEGLIYSNLKYIFD